ncbi:MAG: triose-phosphate isomerase [Bacillota bacterium]|nr:triose-phosphate isomerase [Bacillota bacterium]
MDASIREFIKNMVKNIVQESVQKQHIRTKYVIANWKMNKTLAEAGELFQRIQGNRELSVVVCPPATLLYPVHFMIKEKNKLIDLGAQNVHWDENGAYTGEISSTMLKDANCKYVLIGHSERRHFAFENDELINRKVRKVLETGLIPILCIGETFEQKASDQTMKVLKSQLLSALKDVESNNLIIAYEPVWAIGSGHSATSEQVQEIHEFIRSVLRDVMGQTAAGISILYGGSVNKNNTKEFAKMQDVDGVLVGGASLVAQSFQEIIDVFAKGDR